MTNPVFGSIPANHCEIAARLSRDVYLFMIDFEEAVSTYGVEMVDFSDHADSQAILCKSTDAAFLVFRGTEASSFRIVDIAANLRVAPQLWAGDGQVHSGYINALNRIRFKVRSMAEQIPSDIPLYATGHSLGGALASLYSAWISADTTDQHRLAGLITFGAPKAAMSDAYEPLVGRMPVNRYTMPWDFAPYWPPFVYSHPAEEISLRPVDDWPGPISRHDVDGYALSLQIQPAVGGDD